MDNSARQSEIAPSFGQNLQVTIAPLTDSFEQLLTLDVLNSAVPFWQNPKWWQLANDALFNGNIDLVCVIDESGKTLAALPVQQIGGLLRSPEHPHLTVGECIWCASNDKSRTNDIMDALLAHLNAWGWQSTNSPDRAHVRLCENLPDWQWRKVRESAWFDTTGDMPIPGKLRRNLSRHQRNLETAQGATRYAIVADTNTITNTCTDTDTDTDTSLNKESLSNALDTFLALEAAGWKGESGTAINNSANLKAFYQGMMDLTDENMHLEIHQMHINERCIASQLAFKCGSTRYLLKICYDEEFSAFSPGSLLLKHTMQHCLDTETQTLNLVSAPNWAMRWKPELTPVWHVTRFANTLQGQMRQQLLRARRGVVHQLRDAHSRIQS